MPRGRERGRVDRATADVAEALRDQERGPCSVADLDKINEQRRQHGICTRCGHVPCACDPEKQQPTPQESPHLTEYRPEDLRELARVAVRDKVKADKRGYRFITWTLVITAQAFVPGAQSVQLRAWYLNPEDGQREFLNVAI
jgi:hypothetical protein